MMSHLCSPSGSRNRFDRSIATSAISLYLKFEGQVDTVAIHSLQLNFQQALTALQIHSLDSLLH